MIRQIPAEGYENLVYTYSDEQFKIRQIETGIVYDTAYDVAPCRYTYEETDEKIEPIPPLPEEVID